ncbi:tRNA guanosine(34) transglycosylase Tgt [Millisia brevis]|uniref:tRNA guanosine(34) transglycosylase Tgt n=1 Tax=Millisia brevis TaxID=264148 RepID=UPI000AE5518A
MDQSTGIGPSFEVTARLDDRGGRAGVLTTPHGVINTPAFVPVATKATVKAVLPETMADLGAQALLANAYHLYLQPGHDIVEEAGGLGRFMNWPGPTFTDSGGFQVLSLGAGYKKVLAMEAVDAHAQAVQAKNKDNLARVDEDGVTFTSHLNGSKHRFTPEVSMRIQHALGADIIFAFDELTTLANTRDYQVSSVARTHRWAQRCLDERARLAAAHPDRPEQALFGVVQGAQYEDLRRQATRGLLSLADENGRGFEGFGIGGALEKSRMGTIVRWVTEELPDDKPRHLLGISEPDDLFAAVEAGADTFDCVNPSRVARNAAIYTPDGRFNINTARFRRDFTPIDADCDCYTCGHYTRAYLHHLFKAKEMVASTLATIHNERFTVRLVDAMRAALIAGNFDALRTEFLGRFYGSPAAVAR